MHFESSASNQSLPSSPEAVGRNSQSGSTAPYSTDRTPLDSEGEIKARIGTSSPEPMVTSTIPASSAKSLPRPRSSHATPKESGKAGQLHYIKITPTESSAITWGSSTKSHARTSSQISADSARQHRPLVELFPFIRERLDEPSYRSARTLSKHERSPDAFRREILQVVFGWEQDIEDLIRNECKIPPHLVSLDTLFLICEQ